VTANGVTIVLAAAVLTILFKSRIGSLGLWFQSIWHLL
jgi:hypothetical protein